MIQSSRQSSSSPLNLKTLPASILAAQYAIRGQIELKAAQLEGKVDLIRCNLGNPFALGKPPLTFPRQVLSCLEFPSANLPNEVRKRAEHYKSMIGEIGAYTHSQGYPLVRKNVAKFIQKRDGYPSNFEHIFLTNGASQAVKFVLQMLINSSQAGILTPFPSYPLYTAETVLLGGSIVPYYLKEDKGWSTEIACLKESYNEAMQHGIIPKALVVINPSNPTGGVMDEATMRAIANFCEKYKLLLIADEVYQENSYFRKFVSFKKIFAQENCKAQLVSLHSISKGVFAECGHRGGYMELYNIPSDVIGQFYKLASISLCPNTAGQILVDCMISPPVSNECLSLFQEETKKEYDSLKKRLHVLNSTLNALPLVSNKGAQGGMFMFPRLNLPKSVLTEKNPDVFWSMRLLEKTGIMVVPGSGFGQEKGTHHFRISSLPRGNKFNELIDRLTKFQQDFVKQF